MFRLVLFILRLSQGNLRSYYKHSRACGVEISTYGPYYQKQKQESNKNNTKQKQIQKNVAIVGVCSAGMKFCSRAEACSSSFSSIMLRCGGLEWHWVWDSLVYAPGIILFLFFPVVSPGGCESMWVAALTVVLPRAIFLCVVGSFTVLQVFTARHLLYY